MVSKNLRLELQKVRSFKYQIIQTCVTEESFNVKANSNKKKQKLFNLITYKYTVCL